MGLFKMLVSFAVGVYSGMYLSQNYEIPKVPDPTDLVNKVKEWMEENKKD